MHWNGYAGWVMGVGGALGCDGAVRLHGAHRSLILCLSGVIPGQVGLVETGRTRALPEEVFP